MDAHPKANTWHLQIITYNSILKAAGELQMEEACR